MGKSVRSIANRQEKADHKVSWVTVFACLQPSAVKLSSLVLALMKPHLIFTVLCASLFGVSCSEGAQTQLVVLMDTDYSVPAEVDRIRARVAKVMDVGAGPEEVQTWSSVFSVSEGVSTSPGVYGLPATFAVLADDADLDREIVVELEALAPGGEVLVARRVKTGFVRGQARLVRLLLYRACEGIACPVDETCGCPGAMSCTTPSCVDEALPAEDLEPIDNPGVLPADAGIPIPDANVPDGSIPPLDGGTEPDASVPDASVPDGGVIMCGAPLTICGLECVNTQADPRYCGDCETACPIGNVCEVGNCINPGDCRAGAADCTGFSYCEESTGECLPGCIDSEQCTGDNQLCNLEAHDCVCAPEFESCEIGCVDTLNDPDACGDCTTVCPDGYVCDAGDCLDPGDCRRAEVECSGFTYCDAATGECLRGCEDDEQCLGANERCDTVANDCACVPGFHQCGNACVSDFDVDSCGLSCTPCLVPPNSSPTCDSFACGFVCDETYEPCDEMCCPTSCPPGQALFDRSCAETHLRVLDPVGNRGEFSSIALDAFDLAHISYYARSGRDLVVAQPQSDSTWISEVPDGADDVGKHTSIAVDAAGVVYVAYYDASDSDLMFATRQTNGTWTIEIADENGDVGEYTSLALDASSAPHISYYNKGDKDLMYATRPVGGQWLVETVDGDGDDDDDADVGQHTSLALGPSGAVHISYYSSTGRNLKYATRRDGDAWEVQTVDSAGDVGKYTSLALDPDDTVHISYYGESDKDLLYATNFLGIFWVTEVVESQDDVGKYSSLAFDDTGAARLTYYDETARDLKYAVGPPGETWLIRTLDSVGDVGRYTSIAVDSLGHAHVSYYDATGSDLKYALIAAPQ